MKSNPSLTVFTPTYNRAHTLRRVFASLCRQPSDLFEWLVVDDGSTDSTPALLTELQHAARFPVRTITQPNGGKHRAHNAAIGRALGELTVILDSDDELTTGALETIWAEWCAIPQNDRRSFGGIIGHCADDAGKLVGLPFSKSRVDGHFFYLVASGMMVGEKLPCYRTDVLREFPFPELAGNTEYVPEGTVWVDLGTKYQVRCIDKVLRVYHKNPNDAKSLMNTYLQPGNNAWGRMQYYRTVLNLSGQYLPRFALTFAIAATAFVRYGFHFGSGLAKQVGQLEGVHARALWVSALPFGGVLWLLDRLSLFRLNGRHA